MRRWLFWVVFAVVLAAALAVGLLGLALRPAGAVRTGGELPPECHLIHVINPDGGRFYIRACGTGSAGESWVQDAKWSRTLIADGFTITGTGCGTYMNPCVILAPLSPPS